MAKTLEQNCFVPFGFMKTRLAQKFRILNKARPSSDEDTMYHVPSTLVCQYALGEVQLTDIDAMHLASCSQCRQQLASVRLTIDELAVYQRSQPSPNTLARYQQAFQHVQQQPSGLMGMVTWMQATLSWDSRQQPALRGVRAAAQIGYRLLYVTHRAEVDLMVAPHASQFEINGEVVPLDTYDQVTPVLIQLLHQSNPDVLYEIESKTNGRFRLERVVPGTYTMTVSLTDGALVTIKALQLT